MDDKECVFQHLTSEELSTLRNMVAHKIDHLENLDDDRMWAGTIEEAKWLKGLLEKLNG